MSLRGKHEGIADDSSRTGLHYAGGNDMDTVGFIVLVAVLVMFGCAVWLVWKGGEYFDH